VRTVRFRGQADVVAAAEAATVTAAVGGVILLPTETYYGLGADPTNPEGVDRVFAAKGRPSDLALPVLCADWLQLEALVVPPEEFRVRLSRIWPAALTVVLPCRVPLPAAPAGTLAVRIPGHAMLRSLLYRTGPLTGTSANPHGWPPCVEPATALRSLAAPPDLVLDGGVTAGGGASTVVDLTGDRPSVLRQGAVLWEEPFPWDLG
jgi:tRNA threonylcarbamoyl adenosine modification protein (Sua5/YciO/YrdC/YwlC family)